MLNKPVIKYEKKIPHNTAFVTKCAVVTVFFTFTEVLGML